MDRPGALVSHAQALCAVLNETGEALLSRGYADMAQFILHSARQGLGFGHRRCGQNFECFRLSCKVLG